MVRCYDQPAANHQRIDRPVPKLVLDLQVHNCEFLHPSHILALLQVCSRAALLSNRSPEGIGYRTAGLVIKLLHNGWFGYML